MKSKTQMGLGVGASSILLIFVLLCLTTFATLSLVSARADERLSEKAAGTVSAYYLADAKAQEKLAQIDRALDAALDEEGDYLAACAALLSKLEGVSAAKEEDGLHVSYQVGVSESQRLEVALQLPASGGYRLNSWKLVSLDEWQEEEPLNLWPGELG